MVPFVNRKK